MNNRLCWAASVNRILTKGPSHISSVLVDSVKSYGLGSSRPKSWTWHVISLGFYHKNIWAFFLGSSSCQGSLRVGVVRRRVMTSEGLGSHKQERGTQRGGVTEVQG